MNKPSKHIAKSIIKGPEIRKKGINTMKFLKIECITKNYTLKDSPHPQVLFSFGFSKINLEANLSCL